MKNSPSFSPQNIIGFYREAFDEFFQHYPYCYGYWKKYGETERKHGNSALAYEVKLKLTALDYLEILCGVSFGHFSSSFAMYSPNSMLFSLVFRKQNFSTWYALSSQMAKLFQLISYQHFVFIFNDQIFEFWSNFCSGHCQHLLPHSYICSLSDLECHKRKSLSFAHVVEAT